MAVTNGYAQDGLRKVLIASAVAHGVLIAAGLYFYRMEARQFISPVYTVSIVSPTDLGVKTAQPLVRQSEKTPLSKAAEKPAAPVVKQGVFAFKRAKEEPSAETAIGKIKERLKDKEERAALEKRIDALKKKNSLSAAVKPGDNKRTAGFGQKPGVQSAQPKLQSIQSAALAVPLDKSEEKHAAYYGYVGNRVNEYWTYPAELYRENVEVIVSVKLGRDGKLLDSKIEKSSGSRAFDESLLDAVKKAGPFAPLPRDFDGDFLETGLRYCSACGDKDAIRKKLAH